MNTKKCCGCKQLKNIAEFAGCRRRKDGLQTQCKSCNAQYKKQYRLTNRDKNRVYQKQYHLKHRDSRLQKQRKHAQQPHIKARTAARRRNQRYRSVWFRMAANLRCRQYNFFRGTSRPASMVRDMGCTAEFFVRHIESQLIAGMTMENYGTVWHLDHIYPLSKADLTDRVQFLAVANWRNLRPMLGPENLEKNDIVTEEAQALFDSLCREFAV